MINYTSKPGVDHLLAQRQTSKEWLEALTKLDFADPASVINLQFDLAVYNVGEPILCTGKDTFTVSPHPAAISVDSAPVVDRDSPHEGLMALEFFRRAKARPAPADEKAPETPLPSVAFLIGRLRKGKTIQRGIEDLEETDYILVVDAITPGHPVWLIWDRQASDKDEIYYVHPDKTYPVFTGVEKNFDAAQILPSINDWFESYGNLDSNQLEESIKATGLVGFVKAKEVTLANVNELLGKAQSQGATDTMENNEISEARFAEIKAAVADPFKALPSLFMQKLEEAIARDNSLDQYLTKSLKVNKSSRRPALDWLQELAIADFADLNAVYYFDYSLFLNNIGPLDLATNGETTYSIVPNACAMGHDEPITDDFHGTFQSLKTSALPGTGYSIPTLIYIVGVLIKAKKGTTHDYDSETDYDYDSRTDYVLVVDAVAPGHPVWLVYNHNSWSEQLEERRTVDPADQPLIFEGIGHNFDAAQIFPGIHDWTQPYGNIYFAKCEESVKATCITGAMHAKAILLSEVEVLFRQ
nr:hypothetical protein FVER53263_03517 [Fusarium verticillioides]